MTATKPTTGGLPVLYPEPLPTEPRLRLRETLRRVRRHAFGGTMALTYSLEGIAGEWRLMPMGYYGSSGGKKHKGRKGPFSVVERKDHKAVAIERVFVSEAEAWAFVAAVHAERVDADFPALVEAEARRCEESAALIRRKLEAVEAEAAAWRSWLPAPVLDPRD